VPFLPDHHMVMKGNAKGAARFGQCLGHFHIRAGRGRIAGRMIMREDDGCRVVVQRTLDHFARVSTVVDVQTAPSETLPHPLPVQRGAVARVQACVENL
jgi:hypothetical protein